MKLARAHRAFPSYALHGSEQAGGGREGKLLSATRSSMRREGAVHKGPPKKTAQTLGSWVERGTGLEPATTCLPNVWSCARRRWRYGPRLFQVQGRAWAEKRSPGGSFMMAWSSERQTSL